MLSDDHPLDKGTGQGDPKSGSGFKISDDNGTLFIANISEYWAHVFSIITQIMELSHKFDKEWHLIPIIGSDLLPENDLNIGSLRHTNPAARSIAEAGLVNIGQLFNTTDLGHIDTNLMSILPFY